MKILILSAAPGARAAKALCDAAADKGHDAEWVSLERLLHEKRYKKWLNKTREWWASVYPDYQGRDIPTAAALCGYVDANGFDAVICTDNRSIREMSAARAQGVKAKVYGVLSESMNMHSLQNAKLDAGFLAYDDMRESVGGSGIAGGRFYPYGMPLDKGFARPMSKKDARNYLFIPEDRRVYLLLVHDIGYEEVRSACEELERAEDGDFTVYVPVERDSIVGNRLRNHYQGHPHIAVITYNKKLNIYMESADVVLAQPQAYESYEAAVSGVPLVHLSALGGSKKTADYYSRREMSMTGRTINDAVRKAQRLTSEPALARRMVKRQSLNTRTDAAQRIIEQVVRLTEGNKREEI